MKARLTTGVIALAALSLTAAPASAADVLRAQSDTAVTSPASTFLASIAQFRAICAVNGRGGRPTGKLGAATKTGTALVQRKKGRKAYAKLRKKLKKDPGAAVEMAIAGLAKGKPGAPLAGFLAAHERSPKDPLALINASVMLAQAGKPAQAAALAQAALKLRGASKAGPLGIPIRALGLNAQGYALYRLGRYADAARVLKQAAAAGPLLSEAKRNLAAALVCQGGHDAQAAQAYVDGQRRSDFAPASATAAAALPQVSLDNGATIARPEAVLDLSQGQNGSLPPVHLPQSPADAVASYPTFQQLSAQRNQQSFDLLDDQSTLSLQLFPLAQSDNRRWLRMYQIFGYYTEWKRVYPDLARIFDTDLMTYHQQVLDLGKNFSDYFVQTADGCQHSTTTSAAYDKCLYDKCSPELSARHQDWLRIAGQQDAAIRKLAAGLHNYGTALAANLADPTAHKVLIELMLSQVYGFYDAFYLDTIEFWGATTDSYKNQCINAPGAAMGETGPESLPPGLECPPELKLVSFNISLPLPYEGKLDISVKCESVTVGISTLSPITPFAEVSYKFKESTTTLYMGGKASGGGLGLNGGTYLTWDGNGSLKDFGIKAGAGVGGSAGPIKLGGSVFKGEVSLAPAAF